MRRDEATLNGQRVALRLPSDAAFEQAHVAHYAGCPEQAVAAIGGPLDEEPGAMLAAARVLLQGELAFTLEDRGRRYAHAGHDWFVDMPAWVQDHLLQKERALPGREWFGFVAEVDGQEQDLDCLRLVDAVQATLDLLAEHNEVPSLNPV